jgi:hypothetical protein
MITVAIAITAIIEFAVPGTRAPVGARCGRAHVRERRRCIRTDDDEWLGHPKGSTSEEQRGFRISRE